MSIDLFFTYLFVCSFQRKHCGTMETIQKHNDQLEFFYINNVISKNDLENIWSRMLHSWGLSKVLQ